MAETRIMTCSICPRGCLLTVGVSTAPEGLRAVSVSGNACRRGEAYAQAEVVDPRRVLTSTLRVGRGDRRRLPVRTSGPIPLDRLRPAVAALAGLSVDGPRACGEVLVRDFLGLGVDLLATDTLGEGA